MDPTDLAVPHTLAHLAPLLPSSPARVLEAGCGRGALAAALAGLGHDVTGVDRDAEAVHAARERGVRVVHADVREVSGEYDVVLFTRSLHHADDLDEVLGHAAALLAPGGHLVVEEFAWERVDRAAAHFLHDHRAVLVSAGLLDAPTPTGDLLDAWVADHDSLHRGSAVLDALGRVGPEPVTAGTPVLWRLVNGRGGTWTGSDRTPAVLGALRVAEERGIAAGLLPAVGVVASVRP
ncbi:class I SAM-dependent methyltransferase [Saccharothrix sp. Mg75]|uniref:class I SAM-dependent methyltransferase n=1 Tax=Saccharothrix sp. Mg75 TaxID=3445357 RepID=UPI003EEBF3F1